MQYGYDIVAEQRKAIQVRLDHSQSSFIQMKRVLAKHLCGQSYTKEAVESSCRQNHTLKVDILWEILY